MKTASAENSGHLLSLVKLLNTGKPNASKSGVTGQAKEASNQYILRPQIFTSTQKNADLLARAPVADPDKQDLLNLARVLQPVSLADTENLFQSIINKIQNSGAFFGRRVDYLIRALLSMPMTIEQREAILHESVELLISSDLRALVSRVLVLIKENRSVLFKQYRKQTEQLRKACNSMKKFIDTQDKSLGMRETEKEVPLLFAIPVKELNQPLFIKARPEQQKEGQTESCRSFDFLIILDAMGSIRGRLKQSGGSSWLLDLFAEQDRVRDFLKSSMAVLNEQLLRCTAVSLCRVYTEAEPLARFFSMNEQDPVLPSVDIKV